MKPSLGPLSGMLPKELVSALEQDVAPSSDSALKTFWSPAEFGKIVGANYSNFGDCTIGFRFLVTRASKITGMKFYWPDATSKTVKCALWDSGGTVLKTVNVTTTGVGEYTASFDSAQDLTAFASYFLSVYVTDHSGALYASAANQTTILGAASPFGLPNGTLSNVLAGENWILLEHTWNGGTGDSFPAVGDAADINGFIEPMFAAV